MDQTRHSMKPQVNLPLLGIFKSTIDIVRTVAISPSLRPKFWRKASRVNVIRFFSCTWLMSLLVGCSNLSSFLFFPHQGHYQTPDNLGVDYQTVELQSEQETLVSWRIMPSKDMPKKGCILFLHGNGENISTHVNSVAWLSLHGYEVFLLDYRGYGYSSGQSTLRSSMHDINAAHQWLSNANCSPLFLLGQSMGGALAITYAANYQHASSSLTTSNASNQLIPFTAISTESAPADWPQVAREAMRKHWLTWLLQLPAFLIESDYNPERHIDNLVDTPILLMHSKQDTVVSFDHFEQLKEKAKNADLDIETYQTLGGHIQGFSYPKTRQALLDFFERHASLKP